MIWQEGDVIPPKDLENAYGRAFRSTCLEAARPACRAVNGVKARQEVGDRFACHAGHVRAQAGACSHEVGHHGTGRRYRMT